LFAISKQCQINSAYYITIVYWICIPSESNVVWWCWHWWPYY